MSLLQYSLQKGDHGWEMAGWEPEAHPQDETGKTLFPTA